MDVEVAPEVLGRWSAGAGPLYARLAEALRTAVAKGDIPAGARLPAERQLARHLNVSRSTVVSAYDILYSDGLVSRRQGSGTWVEPATAATARRSHLQQVWVPQAALRSIVDNPGNVIPFTASTMERLPYELPAEPFDVSATDVLNQPPYFEIPEGLPELRSEVAGLYRDAGLQTSPDQIVVTAGAQEAISLVAAAHLSNGDLAVVESPTYPGALDALSLTGARLRGVAMYPDGVDIDSIERTVAQSHVGLLYLIPTFHNPTGTLMPASRRSRLAEITERWDIPVIDDGSLVWLSHGADVPLPLAAFGRSAHIYTIGSMSKLFWGGLRVGWVRCPADSVGPIMRLKSINDLSCSTVSQVIALRMLKHRSQMMDVRRQQLLDRAALYRLLFTQLLPTWRFEPPLGGVSLWVDCGTDADAFAQVALRHGVALVTGSAASIGPTAPSYLRLPLALPKEMIEEGVERLASAWKAYISAKPAPSKARLVV